MLAPDENQGPEFHEHEIAQDENPGPESHERYSGIPESQAKVFIGCSLYFAHHFYMKDFSPHLGLKTPEPV